MAGKSAAEKKADRAAAVEAKAGDKLNTKETKVPVRQREGGASHGTWDTNSAPVKIDPFARAARRQFKRRASKVIYFVKGALPSKEDYEAATAIGPGVVFRNALKLVNGAPLENCDAVAGAVPEDYAMIFPTAGENHHVDETDTGIADHVIRPSRQMGGGNNPDDVRPGTVDVVNPETGQSIGFASGTGAEQPGGVHPNPIVPPETGAWSEGSVQAPTAKEQAAAWKSNKADGG